MEDNTMNFEVIVIGGGLAGLCNSFIKTRG